MSRYQTVAGFREMLTRCLDRRDIRILIAAVVLLPSTALALIYGTAGLILSFGGSRHPLFALLGMLSLFGLAGIAGAWIRLLHTSMLMPQHVLRLVVILLSAGIISALSLGVLCIVERKWEGFALWSIAAVVGVLFVAASPRKTA